MLFELFVASTERVAHDGVREFIEAQSFICIPYFVHVSQICCSLKLNVYSIFGTLFLDLLYLMFFSVLFMILYCKLLKSKRPGTLRMLLILISKRFGKW